jgi:uncharacterized protein (UPF0212 family)
MFTVVYPECAVVVVPDGNKSKYLLVPPIKAALVEATTKSVPSSVAVKTAPPSVKSAAPPTAYVVDTVGLVHAASVGNAMKPAHMTSAMRIAEVRFKLRIVLASIHFHAARILSGRVGWGFAEGGLFTVPFVSFIKQGADILLNIFQRFTVGFDCQEDFAARRHDDVLFKKLCIIRHCFSPPCQLNYCSN